MKDIGSLITDALKNMQKTYAEQKNIEKGKNESALPSRLLFPYDRKCKKLRVSEQEAVFFFTKELEKSKEYYYSVEVPTRLPYLLKDKEPIITDKGSSGGIDVCIYKKPDTKEPDSLKCLVEFKEDMQGIYIKDNACGVECKLSLVKDFLRLRFDSPNIEKNYFVHILENYNEDKIKTLEKNYKNAFYYVDEHLYEKHKKEEYNSKKGSRITIFICTLQESGDGKIISIEDKEELGKLKELL